MATNGHRHVVRIVEGIAGDVELSCTFVPRFDYGALVPWMSCTDDSVVALGGPDGLVLRSSARLERTDRRVEGRFRVRAGERATFVLTWFRSYREPPPPIDAEAALGATEGWWSQWASRCTWAENDREAVVRSLLTLKALTFMPSGAIVAAPTTSLPEALGGVRNWDYRYCWLRDATFTVLALLNAGYRDEAQSFMNWLIRAIAGDPAALQILYGVEGERRLEELELPWLAGYERSQPVRVGNAAYAQFQLDVYGEVIDALFQSIKAGLEAHEAIWEMVRGIVEFVEAHWKRVTGSRHVGGSWRSPALHRVAGHGMGRLRPSREVGRGGSLARAR